MGKIFLSNLDVNSYSMDFLKINSQTGNNEDSNEIQPWSGLAYCSVYFFNRKDI